MAAGCSVILSIPGPGTRGHIAAAIRLDAFSNTSGIRRNINQSAL
jgi:hypothetical protein